MTMASLAPSLALPCHTFQTSHGPIDYRNHRRSSEVPQLLAIAGLGEPWLMVAPMALHLDQNAVIVELPARQHELSRTNRYHLSTITEMIAELCDDLFIAPTVISGHSLGCLVAANLTRYLMPRPQSLILISPPGRTVSEVLSSQRCDLLFKSSVHRRAAAALTGLLVSEMMPLALTQRALQVSPKLNPILRQVLASPSCVEHLAIQALASQFRRAPVKQIFRQAEALDIQQLYADHSAKAAVAIVGSEDRLAPARDSSQFGESWRTVVVEPGSHWLPFEHPHILKMATHFK